MEIRVNRLIKFCTLEAAVSIPFTSQSQIWHAIVDLTCTLPHQIYYDQYVLFYIAVYNHANLTNFAILMGGSTKPLDESESNLACENIPTVNASVLYFICINLLCRHWGSEKNI